MRNLIIVFFLCILFSCTKGGGNIYIEGRVFNPVTGDGIKGIEIDLLRNKLDGAVGAQSGGVKLCELVYTDENGNFEIKHTGGLQSYYVQALPNAEDYYGIGWTNISTKNKIYSTNITSFTVKKGKNMHADFQMVPFKNLITHTKNINCQGNTDTLKPYYDGSQWGFNLYSIGQLAIHSGCYETETLPYKVPMGKYYYHWEVVRNGITNIYYDTVIVGSQESTIFEMFY